MEGANNLIIIKNLKNKTIQRMGLNCDEISELILNKRKSLLFSSYSMKNLGINQKLRVTTTNFTSSNNNIKQDITNLIDNKFLTNKELKNQLIKIKDGPEKNNKIKINCKKILKKQIFMKPRYFKIQDNNSNEKLKDKFLLSHTQRIVKNLRNIFCCHILPVNHQNKLRFKKENSFIYQDLFNSDRRDNINNERRFFSKSIIMPICSKNHNDINIGKPLKLVERKYLRNSKENQIYISIVKKSLIKSHSSFIKFNRFFNHSSICEKKF